MACTTSQQTNSSHRRRSFFQSFFLENIGSEENSNSFNDVASKNYIKIYYGAADK